MKNFQDLLKVYFRKELRGYFRFVMKNIQSMHWMILLPLKVFRKQTKKEISEVDNGNELALTRNSLCDEVQRDGLKSPNSRAASFKQISQQPEEQRKLSSCAPDIDFEATSTDSEITTDLLNSSVPIREKATAILFRTLSTKRENQSSPSFVILVVFACCVFCSILSQQVRSNLVHAYYQFKLDYFRFTRSSLTH